MLKRSTAIFFVIVAIAINGCSKYDDTALRADIQSLESRVKTLEDLCNRMNSDLSSLSEILKAVQQQITISDVSTTASGYVITFSDNQTVTINNGKDGSTPSISVRQGPDGMWYWVLNGDWIYDNHGSKIRATGVTPLLKIEYDYWHVSYNNGATWEKLQRATGNDGDSFFKSVSQDDDYVYLVLADGATINIPKESKLALSFDKTTFHPASESLTIPFSVIAAGEDLKIVTFSDGNIYTNVYMESSSSGYLTVSFIGSSHNGNVLVVAKSKGKTVLEILEFEAGVLSTSSTMEYWIESEGKDINVSISRNMGINIVPSVSWITVAPPTKAIVNENLRITVAANETYQNRDGKVTINGEEGLSLVFTIHQAQKDYIKLDKNSVTLLDDETITLSYTTNVSGTVTWSSTNPEVASVDSNGKVNAVSKGETTITVKTSDGKCSDSCKVTVRRFSDGISVYCSGGSFLISGTLLLYGSSLRWVVSNYTGRTILVNSVYLVDGETGSKTGTLNLNTELANGSSSTWSISVPLIGIHYPVSAIFTISSNGKSYTASGSYTYTSGNPW